MPKAKDGVAPGFDLEVDRGGARPLDGLGDREWRDIAGTLQPGEVSLDIIRRMPAAEAEANGDTLLDLVRADLAALAPLFQLASWTPDSPSGVSF